MAGSHVRSPRMVAETSALGAASKRLEVDFGDDDAKSLMSYVKTARSTSSIASNVYQYIVENGRTYHRYKEGQYPFPNDEIEQDRLDFQHELCKMLLDNKLHIAPIVEDPRYVLDVATGTGIWAIEFAQQNPNCQVLGTDLSPIQPDFAPSNVFFEICDAEDEWGFTTPFDLVHMRGTAVCFKDPKSVLQSALKCLRPGGYVQMHEPLFPFAFQDPPPEDCALKRWVALIDQASRMAGRRWDNAQYYRQWFEELGYVDIHEHRERLPLSPWAKGKKSKISSLWLQHDIMVGIEGWSMALLTRQLGWTSEEVRRLVDEVKKDVANTSLHVYLERVLIYGRRKYDHEI